MKFPPINNQNTNEQQSSSQSQSSIAPVSSNVDRNYQTIERDLGNIDRQLVKLIQTVRKDSPLFRTLEHMEEEIKGLINDVKKQLGQKKNTRKEDQVAEELSSSLRKLEEELEELKGKQGKHHLEEKDKKVLESLQGQIAAVTQQLTLNQQGAEAAAIKETSALGGLDTRSEVSKTVQLIQKMCERIQVGTVGGVTFTSVDMKNTTEVPSYFTNANILITPDAAGKMTIQFSNMTAEQQTAAIAAIQQHPELLLDLLNRVTIDRLQIGDHTVTLPTAEAEEGGQGGRQGREGGGEGGEGGREGEERR